MTAFPSPAYDGEVYTVGTRSWTYSYVQNAWVLNKNGPTGPQGPQGETGPAGVLLTNLTVDTFTGDGITDTFALSITPVSVYNMIVNIDGLVQTATVNYTLSGNNIVFTSIPIENATIDIVHFLTGSAITGPIGYTGPTGPHGGPTGPSGPTGPGVNNTVTQNNITFEGTTSDPIITLSNQTCSYIIIGDTVQIKYKIAWTTSSNAGSGDYLLSLPTGITFNTLINKTYTGSMWLPDIASMSQYLIPLTGGYIFTNNWNTTGYIVPYDTNRFRMVFDNNLTGGLNVIGSSWIASTNAPMMLNICFEIST